MLVFFKAWVIGVAIAAPVGPIGVICIRKTIQLGFIGAISVGFGAAIADSVYGLVAASSLAVISNFLIKEQELIKHIGGIFLLYLAYREIHISDPNLHTIKISSKKVFRIVLEVFFLTLTNPITILSFIAIFSTIGGDNLDYAGSLLIVVGIFLGSLSWWLTLGLIICRIKHRLSKKTLERVRYISAIVLSFFGIWAIVS